VNDTRQPVSGSFAEIKRQLDPAYSYVIFEKPSESGKKGEFQQVFQAILQLERSIHDWQYFQDEARGTSLLVVRFDPGRTDQIVHEVLNVGLPEGITFYAYGSHGTESTSQP
jgi:hypothetical protein